MEREPKAERKGRSAAEVCTSEARKIGEAPCAARGAEPTSEVWFPHSCARAHLVYWEGVAGRNGPLRRVAENRRVGDREEFLPYTSSSSKKSFSIRLT